MELRDRDVNVWVCQRFLFIHSYLYSYECDKVPKFLNFFKALPELPQVKKMDIFNSKSGKIELI